MEVLNPDFQKDIERIQKIPIISTLLDVICQTTGMGFAAVARVTEERWVTCTVHDDLAFGLVAGSELAIKTTICNEIRHDNRAVIINHVDNDPDFCDHHTPKMYGFQSYISVPIIQKNGKFFGTLCAIDPKPNNLTSPAVTSMFNLFADLISFHLNAIEQLELSESTLLEERAAFKKEEEMQKIFTEKLEKEVQERTWELEEKNGALEKMNAELNSFAYIASHDLQEPLRKIQTFISRIIEKEYQGLPDNTKDLFNRINGSAKRMQALIEDLLAYSRTNTIDRKFEVTDLHKIIEEVKQELKEELHKKNAVIETNQSCEINIIPFQFRQIFYNLISNSLKFSHPDQQPVIKINCEIGKGKEFKQEKISDDIPYCHISIADNGIGFEQKYQEKIFELFQRLHGKSEYPGTGLGLAIVKKVVENHHGIITATGQLKEGARFDIYIPVN